MDNFSKAKDNTIDIYNKQVAKLKETEDLLLEAKLNDDIRKIKFYKERINNILGVVTYYKNILTCMRPPIEIDLISRKNILDYFPRQVNETVPDNVPLVFHGNDNVETVKQIIRSGGLFTPEQRGVDFKSFASQIDVTYKKDISVSCRFAESGNKFIPYGAIFALLPKKEEYKNVLKTTGTEVYGGIDGVNFREETDRLVAIITTEENIETLKEKCKEQRIDPEKVCTHEQFIEICKNMYCEQEKEKSK